MSVRRESPALLSELRLSEQGERGSEGRRRTLQYVEDPRSEYALRRQRIRGRSMRLMNGPR